MALAVSLTFPISGLLGTVCGIALGHIARNKCLADPTIRGSGTALAALIIGYISILWIPIAYALYFYALSGGFANKGIP